MIKLYEIWLQPDKCFLVIEYCEGGELFDYILRNKKLSEHIAARIMKQLFSGLNYLHSNLIAHRDIKPENIMLKKVDDISEIKFIDFGFSKNFTG